MPQIDTVARYLKIKARADHPATPPAEAQSARDMLQQMEAADAELKPTARKVAAVLGGRTAPPQQDGWMGIVNEFIQSVAATGAEEIANSVTGAHRFEKLESGGIEITTHTCGSGQVCLEIRVRAIDVVRRSRRDKFLDVIEQEMIDLARDA